MPVGDYSTDFHIVPGVRLGGVPCGIKGIDQLDLVMFEFVSGSVTAGIFTQSHFAAAPVLVGREHLDQCESRYFLVNSGNANAATGEEGRSDAVTCCKALSQQTGVRPNEVIPFSTGVIGEKLQVANITDALPELIPTLNETNWLLAAQGIMTTDTRPKIATRLLEIEGKAVTITGIAKGSGMIQPNMATMLTYIATDATVSKSVLQELLKTGADQSFNRITVDSDTSTNDSCMLTATGVSGVDCDSGAARERFQEALFSMMQELAHGIIRDGEGATKFVTVRVSSGMTRQDCLSIAYAIANSPLVKTALPLFPVVSNVPLLVIEPLSPRLITVSEPLVTLLVEPDVVMVPLLMKTKLDPLFCATPSPFTPDTLIVPLLITVTLFWLPIVIES